MKVPVLPEFLKTPPDGFTAEEKAIGQLMSQDMIIRAYHKLPTPRMKAVMALYFDLGYSQEMVALIFGVSQAQISYDITNIERILKGGKYQKHIEKTRPLWDQLPKEMIDDMLTDFTAFQG